jgi:tetratricopeptide (TPR) repeat protein
MKYLRKKIYSLLLVGLVMSGCELFDPRQGIENPNITVDRIIGTGGSTARWLVGQERQMAILYNRLLTVVEIGSDNYENTQTFFNQQFDVLNFSFRDVDVNRIQFSIADLRESAELGLADIVPNDPEVTDAQRAELHFFVGWAKLLAGELFVALPGDGSGTALTPTQNLEAAIVDFEAAEDLVPSHIGYKLALARTYHALGDKANAIAKANEVLGLSTTYTRTVEFDANNLPVSDMQDALYDRGNFDDLQPLPRLDFLDPKYYSRNASEESPVYIQKAEEAYFILAEAQLSDDDLATAQGTMKTVRALVASRPTESFSDANEGRTHLDPGSRPDNSAITVSASAAEPFNGDLVLTRGEGNITVPVVSGTSVTDALIDATATVDEALELLYLMRQEVFIAEGRRFTDLGLRMPVSEVEALSNSNITAAQTVGFKPDFVPVNMDEFEYDTVAQTCTITHNMNKVLVANKTSPHVIPFF